MTHHTVGIDISKARLDAYAAPGGTAVRFTNDPAGVSLYAINPYQVRCFARSMGRRARTDAVDVRTLARMAAAIDDLRPVLRSPRPSATLPSCSWSDDALKEDRTAIGNR